MAKILLVEDDNNLREIYGARLSAEGYTIVSANDGEEALAIAVKEKPDLIITDVMMPRISGFDMLDILRNAPETKDTKVIMMTALSQAEDKARAEKLGANKYLVKSQVTLEDVAKAVREVLGIGPASPETKPTDVITPDENQELLDENVEETPVFGSKKEEFAVTPSPEPAQSQNPEPATSPQTSIPSPSTSSSVVTDDPPPTTDAPTADDSQTPQAPAVSTDSAQPVSSSPAPATISSPVGPPAPPTPLPPTPTLPDPAPDTPTPPDQPVSSNESGPSSTSSRPQPLTSHSQAEPAQPTAESQTPASEPSAQPVVSAPEPNSSTTPIQVVLPGDENPAQASVTSAPSSSEASVANTESADQPTTQNIGPNLAEALADEEESINEKIKQFEKSDTPPPPPAPAQQSSSEEPQENPNPAPAPTTDEESSSNNSQKIEVKTHDEPQTDVDNSKDDSPRTNQKNHKPLIDTDEDSDIPKKKIIQPSADFLKGGSKIDELLQKEMANEAVKRLDPSVVVKDPHSTGLKDPDQVIDDIEKSNHEINKIAI